MQNKKNTTTLEYFRGTTNKLLQSPMISPNQSPVLQSKTLLSKAKTLYIDVISSGKDQKGTQLKITPYGIENGLRNIQDGITYFGYEEKQGEQGIDYLIKPKEDNHDTRFIGRHFHIKFKQNDMNYYLKDLGHGFGTFIKILTWTKINNNMLLNIGENYIVFTLGIEEELLMSENYGASESKIEYNKMINVKIFSGNIKHGVLSFVPEKSPITMGRSQDCEILIDDSMLSRIHCTIEYREKEEAWFIIDGQLLDVKDVHKKSTNGTWVYAFEDVVIEEGMIFKANHNLFTCSFEEGYTKVQK